MAVRTNISRSGLGKLALIGLFMLGFSAYCLYDGMVAWPLQRKQALLYLEFKEQGDDLEIYKQWQEEARKRGWPDDEDPGEPKTESDFFSQFVFAGVAAFASLCSLGLLAMRFGRWIEADDKGLRTRSGHEIPYDQITVLNKKKWNGKGIAKLRYQSDGGEKKLTLDEFIYHRDSTREILRMVEDHIDHDKITNGEPEPPKKPTAEEPNDQ